MFQVEFEMSVGKINCALTALIKRTEHPQRFHVLRVQSLNSRENAAVIDDFHIAKIIQDNTVAWVHTESGNSSHIVQAIGNALDMQTESPVLA